MLLFVIVTVTCKKEKHITSVIVSSSTLTLNMNKTVTLTATVYPNDADNKAVIWTSSNDNVATVENGKVTAIKQGTAIITVTTVDGNKTANCTVIVTDEEEIFEEPEMIFVEGGTFLFGCNDDECGNWDEWDSHWLTYPPVEKTVESFYISKYLITQKLWKAVMGTTLREHSVDFYGHERPIVGEGDNYPMYYMTRSDCQAFLKKLNLITGKKYREVTSIEWEYAAKGGNKSQGYKYSGSNNPDEVAWSYNNSEGATHPVGTKLPNELGIYDLSGNVCELVDGFYYNSNKTHVDEIRGGCWGSGLNGCRVSDFGEIIYYDKCYYVGFRVALSVSNK